MDVPLSKMSTSDGRMAMETSGSVSYPRQIHVQVRWIYLTKCPYKGTGKVMTITQPSETKEIDSTKGTCEYLKNAHASDCSQRLSTTHQRGWGGWSATALWCCYLGSCVLWQWRCTHDCPALQSPGMVMSRSAIITSVVLTCHVTNIQDFVSLTFPLLPFVCTLDNNNANVFRVCFDLFLSMAVFFGNISRSEGCYSFSFGETQLLKIFHYYFTHYALKTRCFLESRSEITYIFMNPKSQCETDLVVIFQPRVLFKF